MEVHAYLVVAELETESKSFWPQSMVCFQHAPLCAVKEWRK